MRLAVRDRIAGAAFALLGILVVIRSVGLSLGTLRQPGAGFVPFLLGLALIVLPLLSLVEPMRGQAGAAGTGRAVRVLAAAVGFAVYVLTLDLLGFYLASFLLTVLLARVAGETRWRRAVGTAVIAMLVVYVVFDRLFLIPFPPGLLSGG